ncbi:MAG: hypothetical protein IT301_08180 [Dehalococcoidia bacterium]|nr:hypothetical protein [Dehalococcoidia bacterium]
MGQPIFGKRPRSGRRRKPLAPMPVESLEALDKLWTDGVDGDTVFVDVIPGAGNFHDHLKRQIRDLADFGEREFVLAVKGRWAPKAFRVFPALQVREGVFVSAWGAYKEATHAGVDLVVDSGGAAAAAQSVRAPDQDGGANEAETAATAGAFEWDPMAARTADRRMGRTLAAPFDRQSKRRAVRVAVVTRVPVEIGGDPFVQDCA